MTFLDTNVIVRYVVGDPAEQAKLAADVIHSDRSLVVSILVLAEALFVLTRQYGVPRAEAIDAVIRLLNRSNLAVHELSNDRVKEALLLARPSARVSFVDALLWGLARTTISRAVVTFDQRFPDRDINLELLSSD